MVVDHQREEECSGGVLSKMAISRGPILKKCRALGIEPTVIGIDKKSNRKPKKNGRKLSEYGIQLKEKQKVKFVYGYEIDEKLRPVLAQTLAGVENAEVIFKDFLKIRLDELEKTLPPYIVIANLPYYVTTPLVMTFVEHSQKCQSLTVMVQEDVADRLCAAPEKP